MIKNNKQILISTILSRLNKAITLAEHAYVNTGIRSLISCQTFENIECPKFDALTSAYSIIFTSSVGLSNNRNNGLNESKAKYVWFLDDDVEVLPEGCLESFKALEEGKGEVISTCYIIEGDVSRKNYRTTAHAHNKLSIMKVSSIEILCDREVLKEKSIQFDVRFGLGAEFKSGEENIILSDCLKEKIKVMYLPIKTSSHPDETSGGDYQDQAQLISKGAIIRRIYGVFGWPLVIIFFLKRVKTKELSLYGAIKAMFYGLKGFVKVG
jgi:glycosyltransferase involved in cell wall biosynthesis